MKTAALSTLIESLKTLEADSSIENKEFLTDGCFDDLPQNIQNVVNAASEELITSDGYPNYENIGKLRENGFTVIKGESDSFGWLSGVILTKKGKIVYG